MILAAADYAEGKGDPPPELALALSCKQWHTLPHAGGLLDQPAGLIRRMTLAQNVYTAFTTMQSAEDKAKWQNDNPDLWKLVTDVFDLRKRNG